MKKMFGYAGVILLLVLSAQFVLEFTFMCCDMIRENFGFTLTNLYASLSTAASAIVMLFGWISLLFIIIKGILNSKELKEEIAYRKIAKAKKMSKYVMNMKKIEQ